MNDVVANLKLWLWYLVNGLTINWILFVILGIILLIFVVWLPRHVRRQRIKYHGGVRTEFNPGQVSLTEAANVFSRALYIVIPISVPIMIFIFGRALNPEKPNVAALSLAVVTFLVCIGGLIYALVLQSKRPLSGAAMNDRQVYWLLRSILLITALDILSITSIFVF